MEKSAIYHRPESEFAYLYSDDLMHIRLRTKKDDIVSLTLHYVDPYLVGKSKEQRKMNMKKVASTAYLDYWQVSVTARFKRLSYCFEIVSTDGERCLYGDQGIFSFDKKHLKNGEFYFRMPYFHAVDRYRAPEWVASTVWYQIFPERFANGDPTRSPQQTLKWDSSITPRFNDFFGGDLQGIINKLDYLQTLGINGIYLTPIFRAPSNHKYDTTDYFSIDPHFGDLSLFKQFVQEAHKRKMRVMLDAVFNHAGVMSEMWLDVVAKGKDSQYVDWFHIHELPIENNYLQSNRKPTDQQYETFAFAKKMPKFNTSHPAVQTYLLSVAKYWIEECNIDGWRLDVANEVDHQFWQQFYREVTAVKPDIYIVGEVWHSAQSWLNGNEFHAVMNYDLTHTIRDFFLLSEHTPQDLIDKIQEHFMLYRQSTNEAMFNVIDSHDTARMATMAQGDLALVRAALAFLFLQTGAPCLYYGTEVGLEGGADPDCRRVMNWQPTKEQLEQFKFVQKLIALRRKYYLLITRGTVTYTVLANEKRQFEIAIRYKKQRLKMIVNMGDEMLAVTKETGTIKIMNRVKKQDNQWLLAGKGFAIFSN